MKTALLLVLASVVAAGAMAFALRPGNGAASSSATYRLKRGDLVRVPSLGWTCILGTLPRSRKPGFFCTTDRKPIASVWFAAHQVFVSTGHPPVRSNKGYAFTY